MAHIRKELKVSTIRKKIEKAHLMRMGHILRMSDDRLVKQQYWDGIRTSRIFIRARRSDKQLLDTGEEYYRKPVWK